MNTNMSEKQKSNQKEYFNLKIEEDSEYEQFKEADFASKVIVL